MLNGHAIPTGTVMNDRADAIGPTRGIAAASTRRKDRPPSATGVVPTSLRSPPERPAAP